MTNLPFNGKHWQFARTEAVYAFIRAYLEQEGYPPSLRDIARGCGLGLTTANYHLSRLVKLGLIRRASGRARSIRLVENEMAAQMLIEMTQPAVE
jgi:repressor LexA